VTVNSFERTWLNLEEILMEFLRKIRLFPQGFLKKIKTKNQQFSHEKPLKSQNLQNSPQMT
jgi:hypothetical protein